jgi:hypothetical protein
MRMGELEGSLNVFVKIWLTCGATACKAVDEAEGDPKMTKLPLAIQRAATSLERGEVSSAS